MAIQTLKPDVVNKIAAGEVLERPANLVKELVENSIDAGATDIEVEIRNGGKYLRVQDNGRGIEQSDLPLVFARHATSKIQDADDLWSLNSYGFRGEALASLAAVSKTTLVTRTPHATSASRVSITFGDLGEIESVGGEPGTTFVVEDLFSNVPARLKFLKSESAEVSQTKRVLRAMAFAAPHINLRVLENGRLTLHWPASTDPVSRARALFQAEALFSTREKTGEYEIEIVFSSPQETFGTTQNIWLFVQNRWIQDRTLQAAVLEAYRNLLMHGEFPFVAVKLKYPPDELDVNIHPSKAQVKFRDTNFAFRLVHGTLRSALEKAPWIQELSRNHHHQQPLADLTENGATPPVNEVVVQAPLSETDHGLNQTVFRTKPSTTSVPYREEAPARAPVISTAATAPVTSEVPQFWRNLHVLGQSNLTYIIAQSRHALLLIDQHAAHERILFEKVMDSWRSGRTEVQPYLLPLRVTLEPDQVEAILTQTEGLRRLGLTVESLGEDTLIVSAAPAFLRESSVHSALEKLGSELIMRGGSFSFERTLSHVAATMACHSAIRAGQSMSHMEMSELLKQMDEFPLSSFCPHGRPVFVEWSFQKLDREFGRIV